MWQRKQSTIEIIRRKEMYNRNNMKERKVTIKIMLQRKQSTIEIKWKKEKYNKNYVPEK